MEERHREVSRTKKCDLKMAVAMCPPPTNCMPPQAVCPMNDRFYKFGTPSPPNVQQTVSEYRPCYSELEDSGFHSDEEIQKVRGDLFVVYVLERAA